MTQPISFGLVQFRIAEALTLLPAFMPSAVPGLIIGCFFSNFILSPYVFDMLFGTLGTAIGAVGTFFIGKYLIIPRLKPAVNDILNLTVASLPPIIANALLVPLIWVADGTDMLYLFNAGLICLSQLFVIGVIGIPFSYALKLALIKARIIKRKSSQTEGEISDNADTPLTNPAEN
jgi:uncharacterized membrane protein